ncbi:MAG: hypothetical protein KF861_03365 [Planctomycetaceae bacterium]|nr:hypothetical protein [Planctomycetaceae bacterium]
MDQYRGYCVAGMFVVNFLGSMDVTHQFLKHNNTHFSWADSIMPGFLFACGFSYRLSVLKRVPQLGRGKTYRGIARRSLALVLVSLAAYGFGGGFSHWDEMTRAGVSRFVAGVIKADLWEVLAIIGMLQLLLLPVIETSAKVRMATIVLLSVTHVGISWWFNYDFVYGLPTWMDAYWGIEDKRAWDGGCFGLISWAIPMLAGTLVYDVLSSRPPVKAIAPLAFWSAGVMLVAYGLSCFTTLYDVTDPEAIAAYHAQQEKARENAERARLKAETTPAPEEPPALLTPEEAAQARAERAAKDNYARYASEEEIQAARAEAREKSRAANLTRFAKSPVIPPLENARGRSWSSLLADPPFYVPPPPELRKLNYWMMDKRVVTQSFILFATGFAIVVYVLFIPPCDLWGWQLGMFRTFGQNALAAYIIHYPVKLMVHAFTPDDSPAWWAATGLAVFFLITYMFVRFLERNRLYLKL